MKCDKESTEYAEEIEMLTDYINDIRKEMNKQLDQIEKYKEIIVRYYLQIDASNIKSLDLNYLVQLNELENRFKLVLKTIQK